ncbi:Protein GrpE [bacterium HR40]|nr:Protein GrpE [bacterium HR40]
MTEKSKDPAEMPAEPEAAAAAEGGEVEALSRLEAELAELRERHLRVLAELDNVHKRQARELEEVRRRAVGDFARELLEVADNLRRAIESVPRDELERNELLLNLVTGVEMTERQLLEVFRRYDIAKIEPKPGEPFSHELHHAMYEVESAEHRPGAIAEVMQVGYRMGDRLLRPARVGIAKLPAPVEAKPEEPAVSGEPGQRIDTRA